MLQVISHSTSLYRTQPRWAETGVPELRIHLNLPDRWRDDQNIFFRIDSSIERNTIKINRLEPDLIKENSDISDV